jgi:Ca2+:H+ antiporter
VGVIDADQETHRVQQDGASSASDGTEAPTGSLYDRSRFRSRLMKFAFLATGFGRRALLGVPPRTRSVLRLSFVLGTAAAFLAFHGPLLATRLVPVASLVVFVWLFVATVTGAMRVVGHADELAVLLGEPSGTLILTLSVGSIEIMTIGAVMLTGDANPTLARNTMFSVVMIVMNGLVGLALLLGGLRNREQEYNLRGVRAYLGVIGVLAVVGLILPNYTITTLGPTLSRGQQVFLISMCLSLYAVFLLLQTTRHRPDFAAVSALPEPVAEPGQALQHGRSKATAVLHHTGWMILLLVATVLLAQDLAVNLNTAIEVFGLPEALGALLIAVLVLVPEGVAAIRAARSNQIQRSMNLLLGSVLATLAMTIPAVIVVAMAGHTTLELGLPADGQVMLALTLFTAASTFGSGRTNVLQGAIHISLFLAYLLLIFIP